MVRQSDPQLTRLIQEHTVAQLAARAQSYRARGQRVPYRLQILLAVKQNHLPDSLDQRDGVADRLPQGTRLDSPVFREGARHRAPNGRLLRELRISQGVHRQPPGGPPPAKLQRGRKPTERAELAKDEQRIRVLKKERERAQRQMIQTRDGVTASALRKRRQRERKAARRAASS